MTRMKNMLAMLILLLAARPAAAAGLRTQFGEVVVRNLKIGQTYSLTKMLNLPYRVINTGDEPVTLIVDVIKVATETVKEGYELVPSTSWVTLSRREFPQLQANAEAVSDIVVTIPDDEKLLGRRFEAPIWARTQSPKGVIAVGMMSRLLIQVDSKRATEEELKYKPSDRQIANLDFTLYPPVGRTENVALGREVDMTKEHKVSIKLINPNEVPLKLKIVSEPNWEAQLERPKTYVDAYNPKWLRPESEIVEVAPNSLKDVKLFLNIPLEDRFYGRNFFFPVSVQVLDQEISSRVYYKLLVALEPHPSTLKKAEEKK